MGMESGHRWGFGYHFIHLNERESISTIICISMRATTLTRMSNLTSSKRYNYVPGSSRGGERGKAPVFANQEV